MREVKSKSVDGTAPKRGRGKPKGTKLRRRGRRTDATDDITEHPVRMQDVWRKRIAAGLILHNLNRIATGQKRKAPIAVQASTGLGLLRKVMPDLTHIETEGGRTLDEILAAVAIIAARPPKREKWVMPDEPPPPLEDALKLLENNGDE